jgi:protein-disulfide isomerase
MDITHRPGKGNVSCYLEVFNVVFRTEWEGAPVTQKRVKRNAPEAFKRDATSVFGKSTGLISRVPPAAKRLGLAIAAVCFCLAVFLSVGREWSGQASVRPIEQEHSEVAAVLAGQTITLDDLDRPIASRIFDLENKIYQLRKRRLDQMIAQIVLEKIAAERSTTQQQLINEVILAKGVEISPEEIDRHLEENSQLRANWKGSEEELKKKIAESIVKQKGMQKVIDYALSSAGKYGVDIQIRPPSPPSVHVEPGSDPASGPEDAKTTVIEFSDYLCPACRQSHSNVKEIRSKYPDAIRWVFKDYPMHGSREAAEAARCAGEQGRFWDYQDLLFSGKSDLGPVELVGYAKELGMEMNAFNQCLETHKYRQQVQNNMDEGFRIGINMTPTYIINGKMIAGGPPIDEFVNLIFRESTAMMAKDGESSKK